MPRNPGLEAFNAGWELAQRAVLPLVRVSGRLKIAERFIAGICRERTESVKRTAEKAEIWKLSSVVRCTDYDLLARYPSSELLGYYQSTATAD